MLGMKDHVILNFKSKSKDNIRNYLNRDMTVVVLISLGQLSLHKVVLWS